MKPLANAVKVQALTAFGAENLPTILALLNQYGRETHEPEQDRVQSAIIELSAGQPDRLRELVSIAKNDYRDILAWQQLGPMAEKDGRKLQAQTRALLKKWGNR
jgi:hypothetical protein